MKRLQLGIRLEALELPLRRALPEASRQGIRGVQVDAVGDLAPAALSQTGRRELRHLLRSHDLEFTALGCPLRRGLDTAENQEARIEHVKQVMSLSFDLGPRVTITEAGRVPDDPDDPAAALLAEALLAVGHHGDRVGAMLALQTGLEAGETLNRFLGRFDTGGVGVNLDPANLLMNGFDPVESTRALRGRIVHLTARDARRTGPNRSAQEVPLGHGDIDWMQFLGLLEEIEYRGWVVIDREGGTNRRADVAGGVAFLRRLGV